MGVRAGDMRKDEAKARTAGDGGQVRHGPQVAAEGDTDGMFYII